MDAELPVGLTMARCIRDYRERTGRFMTAYGRLKPGVSAAQAHRWINAVGEFVSSGNLRYVVYDFLRQVFNEANPDDDVNFVTSLKNAIAVWPGWRLRGAGTLVRYC